MNDSSQQTNSASGTLPDREGDPLNAGDGAVPRLSVTRLTLYFHHSSHYNREGGGGCHV